MSLNPAPLSVRGLFKDKNDNDTCRSFAADSAATPITGDLLFHQLMWYISAGCAGWACLVGLGLASSHIFRYREPQVQRQLIRILWTPPIFGIFSFLAVYSYHFTNYMVPIMELYEMFALVSVYFLILYHLSHTTNFTDQIRIITNLRTDYPYATFRKTYLFVMQVLPVRVITTVAAFILTAAACQGSKTYKHGHTAINVINSISATVGLIACLRFLLRFKVQLKKQDPRIMLKLLAFKLIVAIQFLQKLVLSILTSTNTLKPTSTMSYNDLNLGLNSFLTAAEAAIICIPLLLAFWPREFAEKRYLAANHGVETGTGRKSGKDNAKYESNGQVVDGRGNALAPRKHSFFRAIVDSIDMVDVVQGLGRAAKLLRQK